MIVHCGGCRLGFDRDNSPRCPRCGGEPMTSGGEPIASDPVSGDADLEPSLRYSAPLARVSPPLPLALPAPMPPPPPPYEVHVVVHNQVHVPAPYSPPAHLAPYAQYPASPPFPPYEGGDGLMLHPAPYVRRKDPGAATMLSCVVPGVGQLYNGQIGKGIAFLLLTVVNVLLLFVGIGVFTGLVTWIWAMVDAHIAAEKINRGQITV